ncbi:hypothetical protein L9F63_027296, partial [Diploptera punctata]
HTLHYCRSLSSPEVVMNLYKKIQNILEKVTVLPCDEEEKLALISRAEEILREVDLWESSQQSFCDSFDKAYNMWYPDIVIPLMSAAAQLRSGIHKLATVLQKRVMQVKVAPKEVDVNKLLSI